MSLIIKMRMNEQQLNNYIKSLSAENGRLKTLISILDNKEMKEHFIKQVSSNEVEINRVFEHIAVLNEHRELMSLFTGNRLESELHAFYNKHQEMI